MVTQQIPIAADNHRLHIYRCPSKILDGIIMLLPMMAQRQQLRLLYLMEPTAKL
jgi:hypothetical protein